MKSTARIVLHVAGAVFGALAVVFAVGAWRLSSGPLSIGFLSPYIEEALQDDDTPYRIEFADTILTWAGWERALDVRVVDMRIADAGGKPLVTAPEVSLGLSGAALLRGILAPSSIELIGPRLTLLRAEEGGLRLARADGESAEVGAALAASLLDPPREDHPLAWLEHVGVLDARLAISDESTGRIWTAHKADLVVDFDEVRIAGLLSLDSRLEGADAHIEVLALRDRQSGRSEVTATFSDLRPSALAGIDPALEAFAALRVPLSGAASFALTPTGAVEGIEFDLVGGEGEITLPEVLPTPVAVRRLATVGTVDGDFSRLTLDSFALDTDRPRFSLAGVVRRSDVGVGVEGHLQAFDLPFDSLADYWPSGMLGDGRDWILRNVAHGAITHLDAALAVEPGAFETGRFGPAMATVAFEGARIATLAAGPETPVAAQVPFAGTVSLALAPTGAIENVDFDVLGGEGEITLPGILPAPVAVQRLAAAGTVDGDFSRLTLDSFALDTDRPRFALTGEIQRTDAGVGVEGRFQAFDLPFDSLADYWPAGVIDGGREWILRNVAHGAITHLEAALAIEPGAFETGRFSAAAVTGTFAFEGARIHYLRPMPPAEGVDGTARFTGESLDLTMSGGRIFGIVAPRATARLSDIHAERPRMQTVVQAEGPAADALALLDHPRLALMEAVGLRPERVGGTVETELTVALPLLKDVAREQITLTATARVKDGRMTALDGLLELAEGTFRIDVDGTGMDLRGAAKIHSMPATIAWRENFGDDAPFASRYNLSTTLTPEGQAALGIDLAPYARGSLALDAVFTDPGQGGTPRATLALDAENAALEIPELLWAKPEGEKGRMRVVAVFPESGGVELAGIDVRAGDFRGAGQAAFESGLDSLRGVVIERIRYGLTDIAGRIEPAAAGGWLVFVTGTSLDARPYLKRLMAEDSPDSGPLVLELAVQSLITAENRQLTDAQARFVVDPAGRHIGSLEGTLPTGGAFRLVLEPLGAKRRLIVHSDDAGAVARVFDIYDNALGGRLLMEAVLHDDLPDTPITGTVTIRDYRLINAPTLAKLLSVATLTGILDTLRNDGIAFATFSMPFSIVDNVLVVEDARAAGLSIGINAEGTLGLKTDEVGIQGTIVPAYAFNSVIGAIVGNIPLLREILVGGEGDGVFAATYRVDGTFDEPAVAINPIATLAPGFLRNLFSFQGDGEPTEGDAKERRPAR